VLGFGPDVYQTDLYGFTPRACLNGKAPELYEPIYRAYERNPWFHDDAELEDDNTEDDGAFEVLETLSNMVFLQSVL